MTTARDVIAEATAALQRMAQEVERLEQERDQFMELAARRDQRDADMQEIMRINNELVAERDALKALNRSLLNHNGELLRELGASGDAARSLNTEMRTKTIEECLSVIPGGNICDPQQIADSIRAILSKTEPKDQSNASQ